MNDKLASHYNEQRAERAEFTSREELPPPIYGGRTFGLSMRPLTFALTSICTSEPVFTTDAITMLRILSLVLLISATSSHQVPFKSCAKHPSDDRTRLDIKTIDINPWPVKDGNDGSANFTIDLRKHLDQGSRYDLEIRYGRYLIVHQKGDLCKLDPSLTCPKEPNDNVQMLYHFKMPQLPVFGKLNLRIQIWDQDSLELCCVSFDIEVEPQRGSSGSLSDLLQSIFRRREDGKAKTNQNN